MIILGTFESHPKYGTMESISKHGQDANRSDNSHATGVRTQDGECPHRAKVAAGITTGAICGTGIYYLHVNNKGATNGSTSETALHTPIGEMITNPPLSWNSMDYSCQWAGT